MLYFFSQRLVRHHVEKKKKCTVGVVYDISFAGCNKKLIAHYQPQNKFRNLYLNN